MQICFRLMLSFKSLFWNIFGFGDVTFADVVVDNTCPDNPKQACYNATYHNFTEGSGYFIYGLYQLIMVTVLLNMLIALMSDTFAKIQVIYRGPTCQHFKPTLHGTLNTIPLVHSF